MSRMNKYLALVRRELQENRALWIAPVAVAVLMLLTVIFGTGNLNIGPGRGASVGPPSPDFNLAEAGAISLIGVYGFLGVVASVVVLVYLLDCLYAERKDRSILFWKSLPVSDAETVLSKLFVAMVLLPVGGMLLALLMQPLLGLVMYLRFEPLREYLSISLAAGWPSGLGRLLVSWVFSMLWFLPFAAYLMLASVLAKRAPLIYAVMPPLVLLIWEAWMLDSGHIRGFFVDRFLFLGQSMQLLTDYDDIPGLGLEVFLAPELWIGVAVGAGMLYTVIRLRRYRDDT